MAVNFAAVRRLQFRICRKFRVVCARSKNSALPQWCRFLGRHAVRLNDAGRCLASEKRSSGKSRGWAWWIGCDYGDLGSAGSLDLTVQAGCAGFVRTNSA